MSNMALEVNEDKVRATLKAWLKYIRAYERNTNDCEAAMSEYTRLFSTLNLAELRALDRKQERTKM